MKLKSFGCSFVYGSDLSDHSDAEGPPGGYSKKTWPSLLANKLNLEYECYAEPGIGNFKILSSIISQGNLNDDSLFLINWTWIDRYDFVNEKEQWVTLMPGDRSDIANAYYRYFYSQIKDMMTSIYAINTAIDFLSERKTPFVMTYMDYTMLEPVDPNWHDPRYLSVMQKKISKHLSDFQGKNFLDWSKSQNFKISDHWHPLEDAHISAADYMFPIVKSALCKI